MPATPDELFAYLDRLGIAHRTVSHPPLFTVEQSRALRGQIPGGHTKNLFLKDKKDALFLVTALEDAAIDLKSLHRLLGAAGASRSAPPSSCANARDRARRGHAVRRDQRHRAARDRGARRRPDDPRHDQLSPAGQHHDHLDRRGDLVRFLDATGHPPRIVAVRGPRSGPTRTLTDRIANTPLTPSNWADIQCADEALAPPQSAAPNA